MTDKEDFNTLAFENKLLQLNSTQESIQSLSTWCLKQRTHHKKIVSSWLNVLKRVKPEQRLTLFYLANDVIQYSKRKNYEFVESWGLNLQKATPLVRDDKVRPKILRIFKIWEQRSVYDEEFLSDLTGLLSAGAVKKTDDDPLDFQPQQLVNKIKQCSVLESDTDSKMNAIHNCHLQLSELDELSASIKNKRHKDDVEKELNEGIGCVEKYTQALQREIVAREALLTLLTSANQYYNTQRGEVKVVAYAYKNFGARVRVLKRKLDELIPKLNSAVPSPPPREQDVPSPSPDEDLELPNNDAEVSYNIDKTFNTSLTADGSLFNMGLSSFLGSDTNVSDLFNQTDTVASDNGNPIEVINSRPNEKQDFDINSFFKTLVPDSDPVQEPVAPVTAAVSKLDALPGLDLLNDLTLPPPTSFYSSNRHVLDEPNSTYKASPTPVWDPTKPPPINNNWNVPVCTMAPSPVPRPTLLYSQPPASPPPQAQVYQTPPPKVLDPPPVDIDQRGLLPPPPPPPLLHMSPLSDVDQRLLPSLPPPPPPPLIPINNTNRHQSKDVDHRNLIPLTQMQTVNAPSQGADQDYRKPPTQPPNDIVESVDMDLSEDEEQQQNQYNPENNSRMPFTHNKVLVGGDNGKVSLQRTNSYPETNYRKNNFEPKTAPLLPTPPEFDLRTLPPNFDDTDFRSIPPPRANFEEEFDDSEYQPQRINEPQFRSRSPQDFEEEYRPTRKFDDFRPMNVDDEFDQEFSQPRPEFEEYVPERINHENRFERMMPPPKFEPNEFDPRVRNRFPWPQRGQWARGGIRPRGGPRQRFW